MISLRPVPPSNCSNKVSYFFFQAEDGIRDRNVTGVQTCALPIFYKFSADTNNKLITGLRLAVAENPKVEYEAVIDSLLEHMEMRYVPVGDLSWIRSEEHTSELQSRFDLVCRLLLEKKKKKIIVRQ